MVAQITEVQLAPFMVHAKGFVPTAIPDGDLDISVEGISEEIKKEQARLRRVKEFSKNWKSGEVNKIQKNIRLLRLIQDDLELVKTFQLLDKEVEEMRSGDA